MLKPNQEMHKVMISTPARFVGSYMSEDTAVQLSFSSKDLLFDTIENPNSRTFLVVTFRYAHDGSMIKKDLSVYGDFFCKFYHYYMEKNLKIMEC